jgi:hypothetical protein
MEYHIVLYLDSKGVIFRLKWSKEGTELFSVSDDRSTRIWKNVPHLLHQLDSYFSFYTSFKSMELYLTFIFLEIFKFFEHFQQVFFFFQ